MEPIDKITDWAEQFEKLDHTAWKDLPNIELYMDQITGYINDQLHLASLGKNYAVTPSMINNYVKGGHISRPVQKKYNRDQLALLYMLCSIKQSLSIGDSAALLAELSGESTESLYSRFTSIEEETAKALSERIRSCKSDRKELFMLALRLTLSARAETLAAEKIISEFFGDDKRKAEEEEAERKAAEEAEKQAARSQVKTKNTKTKSNVQE